jgi:lactose/cellobiose-specific phosphotransferase system IIC component
MKSTRVAWHLTHRWLPAVRDSFVVALPLTMMIVAITVVLNVPSETYASCMVGLFGAEWKAFGLRLYEGTAGMLALVIAVTTAMRLNDSQTARSRDQSVALMAVAAYAGSVAPALSDFSSLYGSTQILLGAFVGVATAEILKIYSKRMAARQSANRLAGSLLLQDSMRLIWPGIWTVISVVLLATVAREMAAAVVSLLNAGMRQLVAESIDVRWLSYVSLAMSQLFWMVGVQGDDMVLALIPNLLAPDTVLQAPGKISIAVLNTFVHLGGSGATAGVVLALLLRARDASLRRIALAALPPALLNVNEILIFGLPIVFSPVMLVPFIAAPMVCYSITAFAQSIGFLALNGHAVSWSTPLFISGYLVSGSWHGVVVQMLGLGASAALYWPFLKMLMRRRLQGQRDDIVRTMDLVSGSGLLMERFTLRNDGIGELCRAIVSDFEADLGTDRVTVYYQGKHDADGRLCGAEALLRWNHAVHGRISPFAIVRLAEESDAILRLGEMTLMKSCEAMARWKKAGLGCIKLSVNVSPIQLESPTFVDFVTRALQRNGLGANEIELEITEGQVIASSEQSDANLRALVDQGIALSMDDFAMGCTSLLYLQRFDVASIKLDGVLTRNVLSNAVTADIVKTICQLGHDRGARIVAEYVETQAQKEQLVSMGCHEFQGYLFSIPMPESDFTTLMRANKLRDQAEALANPPAIQTLRVFTA